MPTSSRTIKNALRRARRDGRRAGDDEQLHLRQRAPPVLRDDLRRLAAPAPDFDGTDAVHTHMTNSRLTDPEVLEWRFPVLVESFAIRRGSRRRGRHRGGDGAVRRIRFREAMTAAILSGHRRVRALRARGRRGWRAGAQLGRARRRQRARSSARTHAVEMHPGDVFVIETPGGGGFGRVGGAQGSGGVAAGLSSQARRPSLRGSEAPVSVPFSQSISTACPPPSG